MTEVRCVECFHMDLKAAGVTMARLGLSKCKAVRLNPATYLSPLAPRACRVFVQASADRVAQRMEFLR